MTALTGINYQYDLFKLSPAVEANIEFGFIGENIDTLTMLTEKAMSIMHLRPSSVVLSVFINTIFLPFASEVAEGSITWK